MTRMWAIVERELRKFLRSSTLMMVSMIFPLVQLIVLGNAFGGKIKEARMGFVDHDRGVQSVRVREAFAAVEANVRTFKVIECESDEQAKEYVQTGKLEGAVIVPPEFSRKFYEQNHPRLGVVVDNTDQFVSSSLEQKMSELVDSLNKPNPQPRLQQQIALEIVELYPYIEYMKYLLPGSIALAMFVSVMIGGGMLYIDDKARGVHEGYLVTPITRFELVFGLNIAGGIKAVLAGTTLTVLGSLISGLGTPFHLHSLLALLAMIVATSMAFNTMMFLLMVRVEDPLVPRAMFGILNTLLYFPSGAVYPTYAFPKWLRAIAFVDPFSYAVHGFKTVLLKEAGLGAIWQDVAFLSIFAVITLGLAIPFFKRSL